MRKGEAHAMAATAGERASVPDEMREPLGWDGIGAILILLVAAAPVRDWVSEQSIVPVLFRALWWLIYLGAAARLLQECGTKWLWWTIRHQSALCVLLILTVASSLWSLAPAFTLQKAASLLGTTVVAVWIGYTCPPQRLMRVLYGTFTLLILSGIVVALTLPTPVTEAHPMGWRGIMGNRNSFGAAAAVATTFFLIVTLRRHVHPLWGAILCALSVFAVAQARSRTAFVALSVCLLAWVCLAVASVTRRPIRGLVRGLSIGLVLGVSVVPFLVGPLAMALGDPDPLNGRTKIWAGALTILRERPLTGYGYAVVWGRVDATLLPHVDVTARPWANTAHNSIAQVATELGIPAAIVACVYLYGALSGAGRLCERAPSAFSLFAFVFLIGVTIMGFAETHLFQIHWMFWILVVALTVATRRSLNGAAAPAGSGTDQ